MRDLLVVKFGGGVNTWALLVLLRRQGRTPKAIVMADPGDEWPETIAYRDGVGRLWLERVGFPPVMVVSRASEAGYRRREVRKTETLLEECERLGSPPSAAYGMKRCSLTYKAEPSFWWLERQPWAARERAEGRRIAVAIGYDTSEPRRYEGKTEFTWRKAERDFSYPEYPLVEAGMDREACEAMIVDEGLPVPAVSACRFCPNNMMVDWRRLARDDPRHFERIVELSRRSDLTVREDSVGFMRTAGRSGMRKLHVWVDGGYGDALPPPPDGSLDLLEDRPETDADDMPCECAL
jgi:hypothetical protein